MREAEAICPHYGRDEAGSKEVTDSLIQAVEFQSGSLYFYSAHFQFTFSATHIPGMQNIAADALSRHNLTLSHFLSTAAATHSSSITGQSVLRTTPGLELHGLDETVCNVLAASLIPSIMRTYCFGLSHFLSFCQHEQLPLFPLSESTLCCFVAYLFNQTISSSSIRLYLSALRFFQIERGGQDPSM